MRSVGCVLVTAISAISPTFRPERPAAMAIRCSINAIFAAIDIRKVDHESPSLGEGRGPGAPAPHNHYMMAVGGAGSFGSPALESGNQIIRPASRTMTPIPAR